MGNHSAGRQIVATVQAILKRGTTETALDVLDEACKSPHDFTSDVEFDDDCYPGGALFDLLVEAFAPGERFGLDTPGADWDEDGYHKRVLMPFRKRFHFT